MHGTSSVDNIHHNQLINSTQPRQLSPAQQKVQDKITEWKETTSHIPQSDLDAVEKGIMKCVKRETEVLSIIGRSADRREFAVGVSLPDISETIQPLNFAITMIQIENLEWLKSLPAWINNLTGVKELHLTDCGLEEISEEFINNNHDSLTGLFLDDNELSSLPKNIGNAKHLVSFSFNENSITDDGIPNSIFSLTCSIDYEGNSIEDVELVERLDKHNETARERTQNKVIENDLKAWNQNLIR